MFKHHSSSSHLNPGQSSCQGTSDHQSEFISIQASSSTGEEVAENVDKKMEELPAEFEGLSLGEESPDSFITIYAVESCEDSAKLRYNPKTQEFDIPEYDQNEEKLQAEVRYSPSDTVEECGLKLEKIRAYSKKVDEIKQKKDLIKKWIAIHSSPFWMELFPEEKELCRKCSYYIRVQSAEEHLKMLKYIVDEKRKRKCIQLVQEAKAVGCKTRSDAYCYFDLKRPKSSPQFWMPTAIDLLPEWEIALCRGFGLEPSDYMEKQIFLKKWILSGEIKEKSDAHSLGLGIKPDHIEELYDMVMMKLNTPVLDSIDCITTLKWMTTENN